MTEAQEPYSIYNDAGYKALRSELKYAGFRLLANGLIVAADTVPSLIPGVGQGMEGVSWAADGIKAVRMVARKLGIKKKLFDFTPDVEWIAFGTEVVDIAIGGIIPTPSHAVEFGLQLKHDAQRLWRLRQVHRLDAQGVSHEEIKKYLYLTSQDDRVFIDLRPKKIEINARRMLRHAIAIPPLIT